MARYWTRCRKCGKRRTFPKHPDAYARLPKCDGCGDRDYRIVRNYPRPLCSCGGYPFLHRKGSKHCIEHPAGPYNLVVRGGETDPEVLLDALLDSPGKVWKRETPPF